MPQFLHLIAATLRCLLEFFYAHALICGPLICLLLMVRTQTIAKRHEHYVFFKLLDSHFILFQSSLLVSKALIHQLLNRKKFQSSFSNLFAYDEVS